MTQLRCKVFSFVVSLVFAAGCYRQDVRTIEIAVPQMKSDECAQLVRQALAGVDGIEAVVPDVPNRRVLVTYNALKLAKVNIEYHLTDAGFDANDKPAKAEMRAKLPSDCR